jgi:hypothetical protein
MCVVHVSAHTGKFLDIIPKHNNSMRRYIVNKYRYDALNRTH